MPAPYFEFVGQPKIVVNRPDRTIEVNVGRPVLRLTGSGTQGPQGPAGPIGTIRNDDVDLTQRSYLNFLNGITASDDIAGAETEVNLDTSWLESNLDFLPLIGGTLTGDLILAGAPTVDLHAATKKYVDDNIGGSGHTIQDDGTPMTARANLDFQDFFTLADNAGADATEVDLDFATLDARWATASHTHLVADITDFDPADYLPLAGGTMTGDIVMSNNDVTGIGAALFTGTAVLQEGSGGGYQLKLGEYAGALTGDYQDDGGAGWLDLGTSSVPWKDGYFNGNVSGADPTASDHFVTKGWHDTDVASVVGDYLLLAGGTMTGAIMGAAGSSSAPGYGFAAGANYGMYLVGGVSLRFVAGGVDGILLTSSSIGFQHYTTHNGPAYFEDGSAGSPSVTFVSEAGAGLYWDGTDIALARGSSKVLTFGASQLGLAASVDLALANAQSLLIRNNADDANFDIVTVDASDNTYIGDTGSAMTLQGSAITLDPDNGLASVDGVFFPATANARDLGTSTFPWLTIYGNDLHLQNTGQVLARNAADDADVTLVQFDSGDTLFVGEGTNVDEIIMRAAGNISLRPDGGGDLLLVSSSISTIASHYHPASNNTYDLGGTANRWKDVWFSGSMTGRKATFAPTIAGDVALKLDAHASQTADLLQAEDSSGDVKTRIEADGILHTKRTVMIPLTAPGGDALTVGDEIEGFEWVVPDILDGYDLTGVAATLTDASTSGIPTFQIHNVTGAADMLSTALTIDANEKTSRTAATAAVIDTANDDVSVGDIVRFDCDVAGTGAKGLTIVMEFEKP